MNIDNVILIIVVAAVAVMNIFIKMSALKEIEGRKKRTKNE